MAKCNRCGKGPQFGHNRSHSMRATNRMFKPNLTRKKLPEGSKKSHEYVCTRCLRTELKAKR
ncbi:MAG: 50S ribosomal protein L28 [Chloroflexi bacterium]|nr:50S ribosomal protein L28 [Chloroflexota bacterium]MCH7642230.1 50S ribosomal protein L28 [Chloroflexota bacterium]